MRCRAFMYRGCLLRARGGHLTLEARSWGLGCLRGWGPTTFLQWLRFLSVFAAIYIFCSFNYTVFEALAADEYAKDIAKSPYHDDHYHIQLSDETMDLYGWARFFDWGTVIMTTIFLVFLMLLRQRVRRRFLIPTMCEQRAGENDFCGLCEDFACMARR